MEIGDVGKLWMMFSSNNFTETCQYKLEGVSNDEESHSRNPLDDIQRTTDILYVMKNGELFEGETLDQIWPERSEFGEFYWETEAKALDERSDTRQ